MQKIIAPIAALWNRGCLGKTIIAGLALLIIGFCSAPFRVAQQPVQNIAPALAATAVATSAPAPTVAPTKTLVPTKAPTNPPALVPTEAPQPTVAPVVQPTSAAQPTTAVASTAAPIVDVGAAPCQPGQIKGNRNSLIFHAPGQRDYAKTQNDVECFDTEAAAIAAGYRKAKR